MVEAKGGDVDSCREGRMLSLKARQSFVKIRTWNPWNREDSRLTRSEKKREVEPGGT